MSSSLPEPFDPPSCYLDLPPYRVAYTDHGEGPAVVAIHGLPGSGRDWRYLAEAFKQRGRLIRVDLPGFGSSPAVTPNLSVKGQARLVERLIEHLRLPAPVVVGHSAGGAVALTVAESMGPRLSGLGLVASVGVRPHRTAPGPLVHALVYASRFRRTRRLLNNVIRYLYKTLGFSRHLSDQERLQALRQASAINFAQLSATAARLRVPTLVAWASDDPFIEPEVSEALARACPDGPRLFFDVGGHNLQKTQCLALSDALAGMLKR